MRNLRLSVLLVLVVLLNNLPALADSHNPEDYPLRLHIFTISNHVHRHRGMVDFVDGEGRANLYEQGQPHGVDFVFECGDRFMTSSGYETYLAKWKKPGRELVIFTRRIGSDSAATCTFKVDVKEFAYYRHSGSLSTEPSADFKKWMTDHHYDPEHGFDMPTGVHEAPEPPATDSSPDQAHTPSER